MAMLEAIIADGAHSNVSELARGLDMPVATAHRQVATLAAAQYLMSAGRGRYVAGPRLLGLLHRLDERQVVANVAAPILHRLARELRSTVQLGTLENDMVTYRIKTGHGASDLFTKVGMQLEAYCSGIGKVLLAHLPEAEQSAYLASGPFIALTPRTIISPLRLAEELALVRDRGFAVDDGEIAEGLICMAVPVRRPDGAVLAAISVSQAAGARGTITRDRLLAMLRAASSEIENGAFGSP